MRRAAPAWARRRDKVEKSIVDSLETIPGLSIVRLTQGGGVHDLLVGGRCRCGRPTNYLIEVKDGKDSDLTDAQLEFHLRWRGQSAVITRLDEALDVLGIVPLVIESDDPPRKTSRRVER